ncbi:metalloregulator ArsR/SmtB family transcription factor [Roseinatronobacter alkalisoli]|uniref:Metalloregulator ArsR/SmtB family transcription factor n=1 Tax=Roseinatronobacter alkalisoli TaxID=3028235 RepID=A0ABT5T7A8_9RHOB|nr:metalloregulator ArsR/SmtB family transcription factor [Roseinatronobacter sp. HJB301]MDD7970276.1 metalloregulator ArsR/SmtB family transcription factor [Roseinatronobacter sp. HJB301]
MDINDAARIFTTLGHADRLSVFRLLMRFAPRGQRPTEIAQALGLKQNTLSHHLAALSQAGLVQVSREGRSLYYAVNLHQTEALIGYLALDLARARPDLLPPARKDCAPMDDRPCNVLFICAGNSARSIFAQALLRDLGQGRFLAYSAGTRAGGLVNPMTLTILQRHGHATTGLHSKHIAQFQQPGAPQMDFVFTVCDSSAADDCPPWQGQPITGHWGLPDPVRATGPEPERALVFARIYDALRRRIEAFVALPMARLDRLTLQARIDAIDANALIREKA